MSSDRARGIQYLRQVHEESQRFAAVLLRENEYLRKQAAEFEHERERYESALALHNGAISTTRDDKDLRQRFAEVEQENGRLRSEYEALQKQSSSLLNLYVASHRLHSTLERVEVLTVIEEIVASMIGSEQVGVFELDHEGGALKLITSVGIDKGTYASIPSSSQGPIGQAARTGEIYLGGRALGQGHQEEPLTACVPLSVGGQVTGVIAIFELLAQKGGLEAGDLELFNLLMIHAGTALYVTQTTNARE